MSDDFTELYSVELIYIIPLNQISFPLPLVSTSLFTYQWIVADISERYGGNPGKDLYEREHLHNTLCHSTANVCPKEERIILVTYLN